MFKWKIKIPSKLQELLVEDIEEDDGIKFCNRIDLEDSQDFEYEELNENYAVEEINNTELSKTFQELLFEYIDKTGLTDSQVYRKAHIDRRLYSKIKSDKKYHPSFGTITLFALALKLTTEEYEELLKTASYSLSNSLHSDITIKYCFDNKIYDVIKANNLVYTVTGKEIKKIHN